jgi:hypothetical protein
MEMPLSYPTGLHSHILTCNLHVTGEVCWAREFHLARVEELNNLKTKFQLFCPLFLSSVMENPS